MGYNENQFSLPRWQDLSISRQSTYDDTFMRLPSQGWGFLPLVDYHGGGTSAAFEPLSKNLADYDFALGQYFGFGVAACYRGYRIYDTPETKAVVTKWVSFFKKYRDILTSDIIHVRRADMQGVDCILHANAFLSSPYKGLAMVFNPTDYTQTLTMELPLYFTGLTINNTQVHIRQEGAVAASFNVVQNSIFLPIDMKPKTITWYLVQK